MTNGTLNASKLRHRLSSRSLSSGGSGYHHPQQLQQQQDHDRVIKYAPMQSTHSSSSHDSRSNSSHEDAGDRHFNDEGSESFQGTDEDDELHHYQLQQQQQRRGSVSNGSFATQAHHHKNRLSMPSLIKSNSNANQFSHQQQPINYRSNNTAVINGTTTTNARSGVTKAEVCAVSPEDLSASSPKAAASVNEMSTPSFSLTQQLLQQNVLSLISSNGPTEVVKRENGSGSFARVSAISVQSSQASSSNGGGASITLVDQPAVVAPYVCDICGKRYVHHRSLNDHKKSHTGATRCPVCNKSFSKVANMRAHYQAQHGSLSENIGGGDSSNNSSDNHPISQEQQQQQSGRVPIKQMV